MKTKQHWVPALAVAGVFWLLAAAHGAAAQDSQSELDDIAEQAVETKADRINISLKELHPDYVEAFLKVQSALQDGTLDEAAAALQPMSDYRGSAGYPDAEEAHYQLLVFWLAQAAGDDRVARGALEQVVSSGHGRIDYDIYVPAAMDLLKQQVQEKAYAESLVTHDLLQKSGSGRDASASVSDIMTKVRAIVEGDEPVVSSGTLDAGGRWSRQMIRRGMFIDAPDGGISNQVFDCENKQASVAWQPGSELAVPESWGACRLTLEGESGAGFEWVQVTVP